MSLRVLNRRLHYWFAFAAGVPLLIIIGSGILLQVKKQSSFVQPPERRGSTTTPSVDFPQVLSALQSVPSLGVSSWDDVDRIDVRPDRGIAKVTLRNRWEAQIDLGTGQVLQTAYRRSDLIESIHDGSFFGGDWSKLGIFLPAGVLLLLLWLTGAWMVWILFVGKRRKKILLRRRTPLMLLAALTLTAGAQRPALEIDPIVGHWETVVENGETVVVADARKWQTEKAATPFPLAAVRGVKNFTGGVLSVQFKMIAGESDQIAGIAFGITPNAEYYYARYNTKDGNLALWRFENGDRHRLLDGKDHVQLPLNAWHELRVEVRGRRVLVTSGALRLEHTLPAPVAGRVGFYTKRDSVTAFKDFTAQ